MRIRCLALGFGIALLLAGGIQAHPLAPSLLKIAALPDGRAEVLWKTPSVRVRGADLRPVLPDHCRVVTPRQTQVDDTSFRAQWTVDCGAGGVAGAEVGVDGLAESATAAIVHIELQDGRTFQAVLSARQPAFTIPRAPRRAAVVWDYWSLGLRHILTGPDHLLFVFGLLLLAGTLRPVAATVTAFTLGHSLTLALVMLGVVAFSPRYIELGIAASVFLLAVELARGGVESSFMRRRPWLMAMSFGLLHGFGFAGGLRDAGLPAGEIPVSLASFNVGIETGQLLFVAAVLRLRRVSRPLIMRMPPWLGQAPVYAMGALAAFWSLERAGALLH